MLWDNVTLDVMPPCAVGGRRPGSRNIRGSRAGPLPLLLELEGGVVLPHSWLQPGLQYSCCLTPCKLLKPHGSSTCRLGLSWLPANIP